MNALITSEWTVEEVLKTCPDKMQVFIHLRTDCVGCPLQRFCTLNDVCGAYAIGIDELVSSLKESDISTQRRMK